MVLLRCENSSTPLQSLWAIWHMKVNGAYLFMVSSWMFFGEVVSQVCVAWGPEDVELALINAVFKPVKLHVNCF